MTKLYTREQMIDAFSYGKSLEPFDCFDDFIESLTPIQLPTDDEILEAENKVIEFNKDTKKSALMKLNERFQLYLETNDLKQEKFPTDALKKVKLFVYKIYSLEYKTEVSHSRVHSLAIQLIIMNQILSDLDLWSSMGIM